MQDSVSGIPNLLPVKMVEQVSYLSTINLRLEAETAIPRCVRIHNRVFNEHISARNGISCEPSNSTRQRYLSRYSIYFCSCLGCAVHQRCASSCSCSDKKARKCFDEVFAIDILVLVLYCTFGPARSAKDQHLSSKNLPTYVYRRPRKLGQKTPNICRDD